MFAPFVTKVFLNLGKQGLKSVVQVLDDVSRGEDLKVAIKRHAVERAKKMGKKSLSRAPARKTISRKHTVTESRLKLLRRKEHQRIFYK